MREANKWLSLMQYFNNTEIAGTSKKQKPVKTGETVRKQSTGTMIIHINGIFDVKLCFFINKSRFT
jgi:hypothetical protein